MNDTLQSQITVIVRYGDLEQRFVGSVNDVWVNVNKFFGEVFPAFDLLRKIILTVDLVKLIEDSKGVIAIAPEGPELLVSKERLTDGEVLQCYLLAAYIGFRLGKTAKETMTKEELSSKLGKSVKITSARLGELVRERRIVRIDDTGYKIATIAITRLQEELNAIKGEVW